VIDLQFGSGEAAYHLIIELHSRGNIILCDKDYYIVTLLRTYKYHNDDVLVAVKQKYVTCLIPVLQCTIESQATCDPLTGGFQQVSSGYGTEPSPIHYYRGRKTHTRLRATYNDLHQANASQCNWYISATTTNSVASYR
jgi:hypothetical protein